MHRLIAGIGLWVAVLAAGWLPAAMTDRFCVDCFATSPNGRYRFSSTHPNNQLPRPQPFVCSGFTFKLTELESGGVVWQRLQRSDEGPPLHAWVADSGMVVLRPGFCILLDRQAGEPVFQWNVLEQLSPEDERHVVREQSTAGESVSWSRSSRSGFLEHEGNLYFVTRTWWDRRVWADLTGRAVIRDPAAELVGAADEADRAFVLETLPGAMARLGALHPKNDWHEYWDQVGRMEAAVHLAGKLGVVKVIPQLHEVSDSEYVGYSGGFSGDCDEQTVNVYAWKEFTFRQEAHLALRRLGEAPRGQACIRFWRARGDKLEEVPRDPLAAPRAPRTGEVAAGMSGVEVLQRIGAPDFADSTNQRPIGATWDYDMDTDDPFSLRVYWNERCIVDRVEVIRPPLWKGQERDRALYQR